MLFGLLGLFCRLANRYKGFRAISGYCDQLGQVQGWCGQVRRGCRVLLSAIPVIVCQVECCQDRELLSGDPVLVLLPCVCLGSAFRLSVECPVLWCIRCCGVLWWSFSFSPGRVLLYLVQGYSGQFRRVSWSLPIGICF